METTRLPSSATVIIQGEGADVNLKINKTVFRLGWFSFICGACAFLTHYISLDHLENFSPFNAGLIAGFFLMIAGLASIAAGYHETSYKYYLHAQIWSFIVDLLLAPGLIIVAISALIIDSQDIQPLCRAEGESELNILCIKEMNLYDLSRILNIIQLAIGAVCFVTHIILLSNQRRMLERMIIAENGVAKEVVMYAQPTNQTIYYADSPPKYEDLPLS
ncbi:unnamed protein product [Adineta ricciae]|uniref:Uncharacterized protein n=1 Tax=Adineta ricciae TaxID=249248 RepID=A0A815V2E8_ADIRI|nr:unnamed protein product [Adineta ricciae]